MDDAEFSAWVADIEAELDMPIEDYAQDVLGDDMPERMPWESDIDYQRRVMNAVLEEVVGENGRIKPEYADDPVARRVLEHDEYQAVLPTINALNRIEPANAAPSEEAVETVQAIAEDSYQAGNIAARALENETLAEESRDVQDESSDAIFAASAEDEVALFDTDLGFDFASGPGLESAPDAATNFNLAAAEPLQKAAVSTPALEIAATL